MRGNDVIFIFIEKFLHLKHKFNMISYQHIYRESNNATYTLPKIKLLNLWEYGKSMSR